MGSVSTEPRIRELASDDAKEFWELRSIALEAAPEAFAVSLQEWKRHTLSEVRENLQFMTAAGDFIVGAFHADQLIGTLGVRRYRRDKLQHKAEVWGVFTRESWRRNGVAGRLLDHAIAKAESLPGLEQLQLVAALRNMAALKLYESPRFTTFGVERRALQVDGRYHDQAHMQLFLHADGQPADQTPLVP